METMEAWIAELTWSIFTVHSGQSIINEIDVDPIFSNPYHQSDTMDEQLLAVTSDTASPQEDFDCDLIEQFILSPPHHHLSDFNDDDNNNDDNDGVSFNVQESPPLMKQKKETKKKQAVSSVNTTKRRRQPRQVQDHIMAERKRRELLGQLFISLSTIIPGLKKIDKTTVLGEAIKHMRQLQEKVNVLEEIAAERTVESFVIDYSASGGSSGGGGGADGGGGGSDRSLPAIEVKTATNTVLLRICCDKHNGLLTKLFTELEKHHYLSITNLTVIPFSSFALEVTIVAQMEDGFNRNVNDFVTILQSALRSP
ncbi:transcription factor bHLH18-like isoform X2 [Spinacia oleracea]|uniref:Transcription factor bHLH18-like isoform X2 n=1 Tax=Spinacia oleracea TaxID=3562 RepID=A0ABM3RMS1_SPIOL|nr:transcription factor bHLH18-like isoform X2 [Spinacia oleracea]